MINLLAAIAKAIGKSDSTKPQPYQQRNRISKHVHGRQRPHDFDARRKTRRKMAKRSRRSNRR